MDRERQEEVERDLEILGLFVLSLRLEVWRDGQLVAPPPHLF